MITKQQALEFIYELSQKTQVMLDVSCGAMQFYRFGPGEYLYTTFAKLPTFESTVTKCIKENMEAIQRLGIKQIPVDTDMLEVGQKYNAYVQVDRGPKTFTNIFLGFDEEDNYILKFENEEPITKYDIKEIWKVVE